MLQLLTGDKSKGLVERVRSALADPIKLFGSMVDSRAEGWPAPEALAFADLALRCSDPAGRHRPDLK